MIAFDTQWDVDMAMAVMQDPHADAKIWTDAVCWLLLNGPPEVRQLIQQASSTATSEHFPDLQPTGYTDDGEPVYDIKKLARTLGLTEDEVGKRLSDMQAEAEIRTLYAAGETHKVH